MELAFSEGRFSKKENLVAERPTGNYRGTREIATLARRTTVSIRAVLDKHPKLHPIWAYVPGVLLVLNLLDQCFTLAWVELGQAQEANVLMRVALDSSPILFALAKTGLVSGGAWILVRLRHHPLARLGLSGGTVMYSGVVIYHLAYLTNTL
jgi:hypothetical protein